MRIERDSLGEKEVPEDVYYGVQTKRAMENFQVSGRKESYYLIEAYVKLKKACALANKKSGKLEEKKASHIISACDKIAYGGFEDQFVVDIYQAGAGTSFNMNVNEVIANVALEDMDESKGDYSKIHPNDDVNMSQSTNDTFPTASHLAIIEASEDLIEVLESISETFDEKAEEFMDIGKAGRTHLMDATPISLGDEFLAYGSAIKRASENLVNAKKDLYELPIGGTATGSGTNTPAGFRRFVIEELNGIFGREFKPAKNSFELLHSRSQMNRFSSSLRELAVELNRISDDLRLLASGPETGIGEINVPEIQPGSSIMPGKVNPVMLECLNMICLQIEGRALTVDSATRAGQLEMNVFVPLISHNILDSVQLLINFLPNFRDKCLSGIEADKQTCRENLEKTPALATLLSPEIGYEKAAELAREAAEKDMTIPELAREKKILPKEKLDEIFDIKNMVENKYRKKDDHR